MPRADFYVLQESESLHRFACRLAERAWNEGNNVHILTASRDDAAMMNDLLWTFRDISFIPHRLIDDPEESGTPVTIGWDERLPGECQILINLSDALPDSAGSFVRVMEPVPPDPAMRRAARERYRAYRDRGFELHNHEV